MNVKLLTTFNTTTKSRFPVTVGVVC